MFVNHMYQKTLFYDSSLIKTLVNFVTVKYNPSLISCNKVYKKDKYLNLDLVVIFDDCVLIISVESKQISLCLCNTYSYLLQCMLFNRGLTQRHRYIYRRLTSLPCLSVQA